MQFDSMARVCAFRASISGALIGCAAALLSLAAPAAATTLPAGFQETVAFSGLDTPTAIEFAPNGRVFVAEKSGIVKTYQNAADTTATQVADLRTQVHNYWDRGLLGLAVDPNFPTEPYVYVYYAYDAPPGGTAPTWGSPGQTSDGCPDPPNGPGGNEDGCVVSGRISRIQIAGEVQSGPEQVLVPVAGLLPVPEPHRRRARLRRGRLPVPLQRRRSCLALCRLRAEGPAAQPLRRPARAEPARRSRRPPQRAAGCAPRTCARPATRPA